METTIVYWGLYGDNGKENGNYYSSLHMALGLQPLWWVLKALYDLIIPEYNSSQGARLFRGGGVDSIPELTDLSVYLQFLNCFLCVVRQLGQALL